MAIAQTPAKIELVHANSLEGDESLGKDVRRLIGNVVFKQDNTFMYCDSAYLYASSNSMDAFGKVRIQQGDTITLTGDVLKYNGNTRQARLLNNIVLRDSKMTLTSQNLTYNLDSGIADFTDGGKIIDAENTLVSKIGIYNSQLKKLYFKKDVVLQHPGYQMATDTLVYSTVSKITEFYGPCYIRSSDSSYIYCENGWYNTITEKSFFTQNAFLQNKSQKLSGDSLYYDNLTEQGKAYSRVSLYDSIEKNRIDGDFGYYDRKNGQAYITGNLLMRKFFEKDTLYLHADSLVAAFDTTGSTKLYSAYHQVRLFKNDIQSVCDSLVYTASDSMLRMFKEPVVWSDLNQLTADTIAMLITRDGIEKMYLYHSAFIASREDSLRYNQLRGKSMIGYFEKNSLVKIDVFGNGQSIYFARNKKNELTGVNRADCSNMIILLKENKISRLKLIEKPDATFYPIGELKTNELVLKGFSWQENKRPSDKNDIFNRN
jgi:lipopolysaccharide export system protein LptA